MQVHNTRTISPTSLLHLLARLSLQHIIQLRNIKNHSSDLAAPSPGPPHVTLAYSIRTRFPGLTSLSVESWSVCNMYCWYFYTKTIPLLLCLWVHSTWCKRATRERFPRPDCFVESWSVYNMQMPVNNIGWELSTSDFATLFLGLLRAVEAGDTKNGFPQLHCSASGTSHSHSAACDARE